VSTDNVSNIVWYTGDGNSFQDNLGGEYIYGAAGTYYPYVEITDANNCLVTYYLDTITVQYGDLNAAFDASPLVLNWGEPLVIDNQSTGGIGGIVTNNWTFGSENFNNASNQFGYLFNETGELDVLLITTDSLGCIDSAWISVFVTDNLQFPNVFSPNGDSANDVFRIKDNAYGEYDVFIYNRWGNKMSEAHIIDDDYLWDGKNQSGELASEGVYFYVVKGTLRDGQPKEDQGFFHLVLDH
jgi:gliding motility-associated-like protein